MNKFSLLLAACSILTLAAPAAFAHTNTVRWPHEGRLAFDGATYVQADYLWHNKPGGFKTSDGFLELDLHMPREYFTGCTAWSNMPNYYSDCSTSGVSEAVAPGSDSNYVAMGAGSWTPTQMSANQWYQTRYTLSKKSGTRTSYPVNFGYQESYRYFCPEMNPWCLNGWEGGRIHRGTFWKDGTAARSSWLTPSGTTVPRDYSCDIFTSSDCAS